MGLFRHGEQEFSLHEEVRDLLLAYARSKNKLDSSEVRELHGRLWEHINQQYPEGVEQITRMDFSEFIKNSQENQKVRSSAYPAYWMLEACYHRCLSGVGLCENNISIHRFSQQLLGSSAFTTAEKWKIAQSLSEVTVEQLSQYENTFKKEQEQWQKLFGEAVAKRLVADMAKGKLHDIKDSHYWEEQIKTTAWAGGYFGLIQALSEPKKNPRRLVDVVEQLINLYGDSDNTEIQLQCATGLFNQGVTLVNKLDNPQAAVDAYRGLFTRYGDSDNTEIQLLFAKINRQLNEGLNLP